MAAQYFATRSAIQGANSDFEAQMQHEQLGPFDSADDARYAWAHKISADLTAAYAPSRRSWGKGYRSDYLAMLTAADENPEWDKIETGGVRWVIRSIG